MSKRERVSSTLEVTRRDARLSRRDGRRTRHENDGSTDRRGARVFFKEHGRDPTEEEAARMSAAIAREDPTDAHLGTVTAEEADVCREIASKSFQNGGEPRTDGRRAL